MKQIKVTEATNIQIDWLVSTLTNPEWDYEDRAYNTFDWVDTGDTNDEQYSPSTEWSQGGPLLCREGIATYPMPGGVGGEWRAEKYGRHLQAGPDPLIAAMRCFVASKLGETVEVPEELT